MIHRPIAIVTPLLVKYLRPTDVVSLSMVNIELRALLVPYIFPSLNNITDPNHTHWVRVPHTRLQADPIRPPQLPLSFLPSTLSALSTETPIFPTIANLTGIKSLIVDHEATGDQLFWNPHPVDADGALGFLMSFTDLTDAQTFFKNLIHLKITSNEDPIGDPETWTGISFDSLISLAFPLTLGSQGTHEDTYVTKICRSLNPRGQISRLRTLTINDTDFTNRERNKYTLPPVIFNLISSELLPELSTFRFPLVLGPEVWSGSMSDQEVGENEVALSDRRPLLRQLLRASARHAIVNSRGTPWRLGTSDPPIPCFRCALGNCLCVVPTPMLLSNEYDDLLKAAHKCERYMRVPDFFTPHLTVKFNNLNSLRSAFSHPAAMTSLTALHLSFPPPIESSLFMAITRLTLDLPVDCVALTAYQPHLTALPVSFPALADLKLLFAGKHEFGALVLPHLKLHSLDINARLISTELPCGHGRVNFGAVEPQLLSVRELHACIDCWDPLPCVGTKGIQIYGSFEVNRDPSPSRMYTDADEIHLTKWESIVMNGFKEGGREIRVEFDFVGW